MQDINRLKLVLVEKKRTNKWLSEQLGINPSTVSKWCTNSSQPDLETLIKIASLLEVNVQDLWGIERSGFFNGREKWAKDFENQRV